MAASFLYFDKQDYALLNMVNQTLEKGGSKSSHPLFAKDLDPHGVIELAASRELRIAYTVINLIYSLEEGKAADRLHALATLYDEVISVADSSFRYNTGRALIQVMKELIRTQNDTERNLMLAHTFRKVARGNRRFVRKVMRDYNLLEMPEEWNQVAFDHHVHDSHTKGRKTPSHLIMDAWIKGIRELTVIYYNFVEASAVQELFRAAAIMNITIQIGIEFRAMFRGKRITFIWEPPSLDDVEFLQSFLKEDSVRALMGEGKNASAYYVQNVLMKLEQYNSSYREDIGKYFDVDLPEVSQEEFFQFVGSGQPSLLHLADLVYRYVYTELKAHFPALQKAYAKASTSQEKEVLEQQAEKMRELYPESILEKWFIHAPAGCSALTQSNLAMPEILSIQAADLVKRLYHIRRKSNITLTTAELTLEDVLELLYVCKGHITHLELFNLKEFAKGKMPHQEAINSLQFAINQGSAIVLKRLIADIIQRYKLMANGNKDERYGALMEIFYNIPRLQFFYRNKHIKTRIGSDATSRSSLLHGMGFVYLETLPPAVAKDIYRDQTDDLRIALPLQISVEAQKTYTPSTPVVPGWTDKLLAVIRKIPGFHYKGYTQKLSWKPLPETVVYEKNAQSVTSLGGLRNISSPQFTLQPKKIEAIRPGLANVNTHLINLMKVAIGFTLAMMSFSFTQSWWFLAWFGAPLWFFITCVRNILQAVLAGGGFRHSSLLQWKDYVDWSRISDSLLYTGISVPLLEVALRWGILGKMFNITATTNSVVFFVVVSAANGFYIAGHNILRGLQKEAIIGNMFRSILAVPLSLAYNSGLVGLISIFALDALLPVLADSAAIVSKAASDTVAGGIEGFADRRTNLGMRRWDYSRKLKELFNCYAWLEVLFPEEDVLEVLHNPQNMFEATGKEADKLQRSILIHSLDLMYFLLYQPRAKTMLAQCIRAMTVEEQEIFAKTQLILTREKAVSQLLVSGEIVQDFSRILEFYLSRYPGYLQTLSQMTHIALRADHNEVYN